MGKRVFTPEQKQQARERAKAWYWANRERSLAASKAYQNDPANIEATRARKRKWAKAHPKPLKGRTLLDPEEKKRRNRTRQQRWAQKNEPRLKADRAAYYEANKERLRAVSRARAATHADEATERARVWRETHPERYAAHAHTRRVKSGPAIAADVAVELLNRRVCFYCGVGIHNDRLPQKGRRHPCKSTIDHRLPISRGGTNSKENLVAACLDCNCRKNNKTADEFFEYLAKYRRRTAR